MLPANLKPRSPRRLITQILPTVPTANVHTPEVVAHLVRVRQIVQAACMYDGEGLGLLAAENLPAWNNGKGFRLDDHAVTSSFDNLPCGCERPAVCFLGRARCVRPAKHENV